MGNANIVEGMRAGCRIRCLGMSRKSNGDWRLVKKNVAKLRRMKVGVGVEGGEWEDNSYLISQSI